MAKQKLELADKSLADLQTEAATLEQEYQQMKFEHAVRGLGNPLELRELRRNIARIHTEVRAREIGEMAPEQLETRSKLRARRRRNK
jgi:large subunit ribosomal protein L29